MKNNIRNHNVIPLKPSIRDIDKANSLAYDLLATEYIDASHHTCRDFDKANDKIIKNFSKKLNRYNFSQLNPITLLEIGPGPRAILPELEKNLTWPVASRYVVDISKNMIEEVSKISPDYFTDCYVDSAIEPVHWNSRKYNLVVALTCDPYLTRDFLLHLASAMKTGAFALLTWPAETWCRAVKRDEQSKTSFRLRSSDIVKSYSFCESVRNVQNWAVGNNLVIVSLKTISLNEITGKSPLNIKIASAHGSEIQFMNGLLLQKSNG